MAELRRPESPRLNGVDISLVKHRDPHGEVRGIALRVERYGRDEMHDPAQVRALGEFLLKAADWMEVSRG